MTSVDRENAFSVSLVRRFLVLRQIPYTDLSLYSTSAIDWMYKAKIIYRHLAEFPIDLQMGINLDDLEKFSSHTPILISRPIVHDRFCYRLSEQFASRTVCLVQKLVIHVHSPFASCFACFILFKLRLYVAVGYAVHTSSDLKPLYHIALMLNSLFVIPPKNQSVS